MLISFGLFSEGGALNASVENIPGTFCICFCKILRNTTIPECILSLFLAYFSPHYAKSMNWVSASTSASFCDHEFSRDFCLHFIKVKTGFLFYFFLEFSVFFFFFFNLLLIIVLCALKLMHTENRLLLCTGPNLFTHVPKMIKSKTLSQSVSDRRCPQAKRHLEH